MSENGFLYIAAENSRKLIKIGISNDTDRRESELNSFKTKMPWTVTLIKEIESPYYKDAEKYLHSLYERNHVVGEWFDLGFQEVFCLQSLTPIHLEYLCTQLKTPIMSLSQIVGGPFQVNPMEDADSSLMLENRRLHSRMEGMKEMINDLSEDKIRLERENIAYRMGPSPSISIRQTEALVKSALSSHQEPLSPNHHGSGPMMVISEGG